MQARLPKLHPDLSFPYKLDAALISRTSWSCPLRADVMSFLYPGVNPGRFRKATDSLGDVESEALLISGQPRITPRSSKCDVLARRPTVAFTIANSCFAPALGCRRRLAGSCILCYGSKAVILWTWNPPTTCGITLSHCLVSLFYPNHFIARSIIPVPSSSSSASHMFVGIRTSIRRFP